MSLPFRRGLFVGSAARCGGAAIVTVCLWFTAAAATFAGPHLVVDARTGEVLTQSRATDRWYPASLTKLMTTYVVLREIRRGAITLQSPVRISAKAAEQPPSKMGFPWKTILTVDTALKIIMVKSANDVAAALGESVGGSEAAFADLMNAYSREIGMADSHWVNAHGLHDENQYSSARDLALLAIRLKTEFEEHASLFNIHAIRVGKKLLKNHNALLRRFAGTTGMKTGFICAGGVSIVATGNLQNRDLIAVVLGHRSAKERNVRAAELLTAASNRIHDENLPNVYERPVTGVPVAPVDISAAVCGRRGKERVEPEPSDPAVNYFPIKSESLEEREERYFTMTADRAEPLTLMTGQATGPDPFGLLTDKLPIVLWEGDAPLQQPDRFELSSGVTVAVPATSPLTAKVTSKVLSPGGGVMRAGALSTAPTRKPDRSETPAREGMSSNQGN